MLKGPSSPNGNKYTPSRAGNLSEQQCLWLPTISQHSPPPPSPSHSRAQTAAFPTPCLSSRRTNSGRLAFALFFFIFPEACKEPSPVLILPLNYGFSNDLGRGHVDHTRQTPFWYLEQRCQQTAFCDQCHNLVFFAAYYV